MEEELDKNNGRDMTPQLIGETYLKKATTASSQRCRYGLYECPYCGEHWECKTTKINNNITKGCGCQKGKGYKHGLESNRFYNTWNHMVGRCNNPKNKKYMDYGGRGISVCEEWLNVSNFVAWAEETYPNIEGISLDRIDNDAGYSPENCRWADRTTQNINQRIKKNNKSGYVGVHCRKGNSKCSASIGVNNKLIHLGSYLTKEEAVQARDNYIIENNLPHKLSTDYV